MTDDNQPQKPGPSKSPKGWRNAVISMLIGAAILLFTSSLLTTDTVGQNVTYSTFISELSAGNIQEVVVKTTDKIVVGKTKSDVSIKTYYVDDQALMSALNEQGVTIRVNPASSNWVSGLLLQAFFPFLLIGLIWFFLLRPAQGASNQAMNFGKSKAKDWKKGERPKITFKDVAGVDEAVEELQEIVSFLKEPKRYQDIGAKIPKGVLLTGPPGTGKTLLAKAVAGEADVQFFSISGSDFVEMFVGVGASRVRDLFNRAKKAEPSIIFIDEIDAVGRQRGAGLGGGHDEREQTLNQMLVEMDGFEDGHTVIVIAATNRSDILDPALLRPGRFDRQITVDRPDIQGRHEILKIHAKKRKLVRGINLENIAKTTPGFTGADLANLINEAALLAARHGKKRVRNEELLEAAERIMAGPERKSRRMTDKDKETIAYHEVGHAMIAHLCDNADPVHKISILPRGHALGYTLQLPSTDKFLVSKSELLDEIKVLLGGRVAEELIFGEITTGASNDIERATSTARSIVCKYGMSESMGPRKYGKSQETVFLGRDYSDHSSDYSQSTATQLDEEIQAIIATCYKDVTTLLKKHKKKLVDISKKLMEIEVMDAKLFATMMAG